MTAVILINWNGADDTIACLASLDKAQGDFMVVVADNGSTDDSLKRIGDYAASLSIRVDVVALGHNYGFAVGNNKAIEHSRKYNPDSFLILNNDTEVEPDFLKRLQDYREEHPGIKVLGPIIKYWYDRNKIWSCGGKLVYGSRKGYYKDLKADEMDTTPMPVSFISGCALFADDSLLDSEGHLFTERFFFGEEDFEFAHRMARKGEKMVILRDSVIYHKVGSATNNVSDKAQIGRHYLYYLGRLIVVREYYSRINFAIIRLLSFASCLYYFRKDGLTLIQSFRLVCRLMSDAHTKYGVGYDDFMAIVIDGSFFKEFES